MNQGLNKNSETQFTRIQSFSCMANISRMHDLRLLRYSCSKNKRGILCFSNIFFLETHITIMLFISLGKEKYNLSNDV